MGVCSQMEEIILDYKNKSHLDIDLYVFSSSLEFYNYIKTGNIFDLIFLDIEMGDISGVELGNMIRNKLDNHITKIVYVSGRSEYYRQLFDVQPMHFLSKPILPELVIDDINLAMKILNKIGGFFTYRHGNETFKVFIRDIIYIESSGRKIKIVTRDKNYEFYGSLSSCYDYLEKYNFLSIHRSYIVNYYHVREFQYKDLVMSNLACLPISQSKRRAVKQFQLKYEREGFVI